MLALTLLAPERLWLLALLPLALVAYLVLQRRRRHVAVRHPDLALVASVAPRRAGWRRHLAAAALAVAVAALIGAVAGPAEATEVPQEDAVVVLAIDTSFSMTATDIAPDRLTAAVDAATSFVEDAPDAYRIGLVAFGDTATTLAPPTRDHEAVVDALATLEPGPGTATGDGLARAVDLVSAAEDEVITGEDDAAGAVVLLADGSSSVGLPLDTATEQAADAGVVVHTVAYGTDEGTVTVDGVTTAVPADAVAMAEVAEATGGRTYTATSAAVLGQVYAQIGTHIGTEVTTLPVTTPFGLVALVGLTLAAVAALLWTPRIA